MTPSLNAEQYALLISLDETDRYCDEREHFLLCGMSELGLAHYEWCDDEPGMVEWHRTDAGRIAVLCYRVARLGTEVPA